MPEVPTSRAARHTRSLRPWLDELASVTQTPATPGRLGFITLYTAGVHGHHPGAHRAAAGHPGAEDQLAGRDRAGAEQPGTRRRHRRPGGDVRQPVLRQDERPHLVAAGHAAAVDGDRAGRGLARRPGRRGGAQRRGRPGRLVHRPAVLQRAARRRWSPYCPTRSRSTNAVWSRASSGICMPIASVGGTFLVQLFAGNQLAMFLAPCAIGGFFILLFAARAGRPPARQRRTGRRGRCGSSSARSTSTRARARTSRGPSSAGSCSSWPTPS